MGAVKVGSLQDGKYFYSFNQSGEWRAFTLLLTDDIVTVNANLGQLLDQPLCLIQAVHCSAQVD